MASNFFVTVVFITKEVLLAVVVKSLTVGMCETFVNGSVITKVLFGVDKIDLVVDMNVQNGDLLVAIVPESGLIVFTFVEEVIAGISEVTEKEILPCVAVCVVPPSIF